MIQICSEVQRRLVELREEPAKRVIYLISGPLGAGKSTVSKALAGQMEPCVLLEGDHLLHMFRGSEPSWEERLSLTWKNIVTITRNYIDHGLNVIIDFVVEDELEWVYTELTDGSTEIRYVVLRAHPDQLAERLKQRGDPDSLTRSLFLLNVLENSPANQGYLYDTTGKPPEGIAEVIRQDPRFLVRIQP
ncbi:AAA family ATPase [Paenibacillus mucilaginosus]|uniref:AAA family ATPase n=1 Tax=Paenibacillus mucilaginosus TaxID=61624 RepID=UPI003D204AFD